MLFSSTMDCSGDSGQQRQARIVLVQVQALPINKGRTFSSLWHGKVSRSSLFERTLIGVSLLVLADLSLLVCEGENCLICTYEYIVWFWLLWWSRFSFGYLAVAVSLQRSAHSMLKCSCPAGWFYFLWY